MQKKPIARIIERAKKNMVIALLVSVAILVVVVMLTIDRRTAEAIKQMRFSFLFLALLLTLASYFFSGLAFKILADALHKKLSAWEGFEVFTGASFINLTTPFFNIANLPVKIYFLTNFNISYIDATAIVATHAILSVWFFLLAPVVLLLTRLPVGGTLLGPTFYIGMAAVFFITILFVVFIVKPVWFERATTVFLLNSLSKRVFAPKKLELFVSRFVRQIEMLNIGLRHLFRQAPFSLFLAFLAQILSWITIIATVPVILMGLNWFNFLPEIFLRVLVLNFFVSIAPTPGGSGVAEVGIVAALLDLIPKFLIAPVVLLWRFTTFYLIYALSAIFFLILINMRSQKG